MIGYFPTERRREKAGGWESGRVWMKGYNDFASISFADPIPLGLDYDVIPVPK